MAELGELQLTIRDYLRHANLSVTNKYLQTDIEDEAERSGEAGQGDSEGALAARENR